MKTLLIIDAGLGQARAYMAKTLLSTAAQKAQLELIDNPNDAELAIVLGAALPADSRPANISRPFLCPAISNRRDKPFFFFDFSIVITLF